MWVPVKHLATFLLNEDMDYDKDTRYYVILSILLFVSSLSIIGDLYIIRSYLKVGFVKETLTRLMAHQAFFDLIFCTSFFMQLSIDTDDDSGPNTACKIQAFIQQFGQSSVMFDLLIAYVGYQIMLDKNERRHRKWFYFIEGLIWAWAIFTSVAAWPYYDVTNEAGFCWITSHHKLRFYFLYLPVWLIFYYICIILILVAKRISEHSVELRNLQEEYLITRILRTEEILRSYLVIYLVTKSPATFFRLVADDDDVTWETTLIMGTFWAITGFLHAWRFRRYMNEVVEAQEREFSQQQLLDPYLSPFTEQSPIQREVAAKIQPLITKDIVYPKPCYFFGIIIAYFILLPLVWFIFWIFAAYRDHTTQSELLQHLLWAMVVVFAIGIALWSWTVKEWAAQFLGMFYLGVLLLSPTMKLPVQRMIHNIEKTQHNTYQYVQRNWLNVILFMVVMLECIQLIAIPILNYNIQGKLSNYYFWFMIFLLGVRRKPTFRMWSMLMSFLAWNFVYCFPLVVEIVSGQPFLENFRRTRLYQVFHTLFVNGGIIYTVVGCTQIFGCVPGFIDEVKGDKIGKVDLCNHAMRNGWIAISVITLFQLLISCSLEPPGFRPSIIHDSIQIRDVPFFSCLKNFLFCTFIPLASLLRHYSNTAGLIVWFIFSLVYAAANSVVRPCSFDAVNHIRTYFSLCSAWTSLVGLIYIFRFHKDQDVANHDSDTDYYVLGVNMLGWIGLTVASYYWEKKVRRLYSIAAPLDVYSALS